MGVPEGTKTGSGHLDMGPATTTHPHGPGQLVASAGLGVPLLNSQPPIFVERLFSVHGPFERVCVLWPGCQGITVQLAKISRHRSSWRRCDYPAMQTGQVAEGKGAWLREEGQSEGRVGPEGSARQMMETVGGSFGRSQGKAQASLGDVASGPSWDNGQRLAGGV